MADDTVTGAEIQGGTQPGQAPNAGGKMFSQDDLNRVVGETKAAMKRQFDRQMSDFGKRAADDAIATLLAEHGIDSVESLATVTQTATQAPTELDQLKREMTKLKAQHTKVANEKESTAAEAEKLRAKLRETVTKSAVISIAAEKSVDPDLVWRAVQDRIDHDDNFKPFVKSEDGSPAETTITQLIDGELQKRPYLLKATGVPGSGGRPVTGGSGNSKPDYSKRENRIAALREAGLK